MHRCIALLLLAAITPLLGCSSTLVRADKALSLSVGWEDYEHVEVDLASGSIDIMPQAGLDAVRIEGSLYARGATMAEAQRSFH